MLSRSTSIFCESILIIIVFLFLEKKKIEATNFNFRFIRLHENENPVKISNAMYAVCSMLCALIRIIGSINYNDRRIFISFSFPIQSDHELWQWWRYSWADTCINALQTADSLWFPFSGSFLVCRFSFSCFSIIIFIIIHAGH